jgi:dATP pyrophosphohydrolase
MLSLDPRGTRIDAGVVDVVVLAAAPSEAPHRWQVLALRRTANARCPGSWEIVHGKIEPDETPVEAALREVREETGLTVERLYNITVNPFYLHRTNTVQLAIVFAVVVTPGTPTLGIEHDAAAWHTPAEAVTVLAWPREKEALSYTLQLLAAGDAGAVEDVLRVC